MSALSQGVIIIAIAGLLVTIGGIFAIIDPKIQGARDVKMIQSATVREGETFASRVGGIALTGIGLTLLLVAGYVAVQYVI